MSRYLNMEVFMEYPTLKSNIGLAEREILALVYICYFKMPSVLSFPDNLCSGGLQLSAHPAKPPIVTNAGHEELGVSADGHASAPPSGAAAAAPSAGA
jgi:hypothetical protein